MSCLVVLLAVIYYLFLHVKRNKIDIVTFRFLILFSCYWFISLFFSSLGLFGLYVPSLYTYLLLFLLIISFTIGATIGCKINLDSNHGLLCIKSILSIHRNKAFKSVLILASIYVYSKILIFRELLFIHGNSGIIRSTLSGNGLDEQIYGSEFPYVNFFLLPLFLYLSPYFAYKIVHKRDIWCMFSGLFLIGYSIITVSRFGFLRFALALVFLEFVLNISKAKLKHLLLGSCLLLGLLISAFSISSGARTGNMDAALETGFEDVKKDMVSYSCAPTIAFDYAINNNYVDRAGGFQLGFLSLSSIETALKITLGRLFPFQTSLERIEFKQDAIINLGDNFSWNALYSAAFFFYLDFGFFGVILFPFLFGRLFYYCLKCYSYYPTYSIVILLFAFFRGAIFSVIDYEYTGPIFCLFFIFMYNQWRKDYKSLLKNNIYDGLSIK